MKKKTTNPLSSISPTNKYILFGLGFLIWLVFIDKHSVIKQKGLNKTIDKLEYELASVQEKYESALETKKDIEMNPERYARNNYYMHRPDETVFVIKK